MIIEIISFHKNPTIESEIFLGSPETVMVSKAYPALASYSKGKKISGDFGMEIYDLQSRKIFYCMPVGTVE